MITESRNVIQSKKQYDGNLIDLVKFILSFLVVAIHINPLGKEMATLRYPICRIAVPLFFIISSYFFFSKIKSLNNRESLQYLIKFVKRNMILYFSWFIVLLPITIEVKEYYKIGIINSIKNVIVSIIFSSSFKASWYIAALVICILLVFFLSKRMNNFILLLLGLFIYILCCAVSNYKDLILHIDFITFIRNMYPGYIYNGFPVGFLWVVFGKIIAENYKVTSQLTKRFYFLLLFSLVMLFIERNIIYDLDVYYSTDCYLSLALFCPLLFILILHYNCTISYGKIMRVCSTVIYCLHFSLKIFLSNFFPFMNSTVFPTTFFVYVMVCLICIILSLIIYYLSKYKMLYWLKNFY